MPNATRLTPFLRRSPLRARTARVVAAVALAALIVPLPACSGAASSDGPPTAPARPGNSSLVGKWEGTGKSSHGAGLFGITLNADSTMSVESTSTEAPDVLLFCSIDGTWTVSNGQFTGTGRDCTRIVVRFVAPVTADVLTGEWSASDETAGTFALRRK